MEEIKKSLNENTNISRENINEREHELINEKSNSNKVIQYISKNEDKKPDVGKKVEENSGEIGFDKKPGFVKQLIKKDDNEIGFERRTEPIFHEVNEEKRFIDEKAGKIDEEAIEFKKDEIFGFFKKNYNWLSYFVLAVILFFAVRVRTKNLSGLRDVTNGAWTLAPDLDPFLFLRYAKYIVEHGSLMAVDMMRYVPLGFNVERGFVLHYYLIAWFHKYLGPVFGTESVTHSAVLFPVFMFVLTFIVFFLLVKKIFLNSMGKRKSNLIALIATFLLSVLPLMLQKTIAGIPEKESAAFLFFFLTFYFFLSAWQSDGKIKGYVFSVLAGFSTAAMALIWGGFEFIFSILVPAVFISFLIGKLSREQIYYYAIWILAAFIPMFAFSARYSLTRLLSSIVTGSSVVVLIVIIVNVLIFNGKLRRYFEKSVLAKIPPKINSLIVSLVIIGIVATIIWGVSFVPSVIGGIINDLVKPATSRLIQTVDENVQPYFIQWVAFFGPKFYGIYLTFWLLFIGSIYLFIQLVRDLKKKERLHLILAYIFFLLCLIFSRYSESGRLNGESVVSLILYGLGFLIFVFTLGFYYYKRHRDNELDGLKQIRFEYIFLLMFLLIGLLSARASMRTVIVLAIPASIIIAYLAVSLIDKAKKNDDDKAKKLFYWIIAGLIILSILYSGLAYYREINQAVTRFIPGAYEVQWQKAMEWVRENTRNDAVFGHWWDYGYWIQTMGERATILDGGNGISYWNHLMGRYVLTATDDWEGLEFLYAHNATHFLIDPTDAGKYFAYSSVGSDKNFDKRSQITLFMRDVNQMRETKNSTILFYSGTMLVDEDIKYNEGNNSIFLPSGSSRLRGILIELSKDGTLSQPLGIFEYLNKQYSLPIRYVFYNEKFIDFEEGVGVGIYVLPVGVQQGVSSMNIDTTGALIYLSGRSVNSQYARLYLYEEDNPYYRLVYSEDDLVIQDIKAQKSDYLNDIMLFEGIIRGPIKIWEIDYPEGIEYKEKYIDSVYPEDLRLA